MKPQVQFQTSTKDTLTVELPQVVLKKSKYSTQPGSIHATRVQFSNHQQAFEEGKKWHFSENINQKRQDTLRSKAPPRLGERPAWNGTTSASARFPDRPLMRTLHEFQSMKQPVNFRAEQLPDTYQSTLYVPKPSKFQVDQRCFVPESERHKLVEGGNVRVNTRTEFDVSKKLNDKTAWNNTTSICSDYSKEYYRKKEYPDCRAITALTNMQLLGGDYVGPVQREAIRGKRIRELKMAQRAKEVYDTHKFPTESYTLTKMRQVAAEETAQAAAEYEEEEDPPADLGIPIARMAASDDV